MQHGPQLRAPVAERAFAIRMRQARKQRDWTQTTLAKRLRTQGFDLHQSAIAKMERDSDETRRPIRLNEAVAIADVLGKPLTWMCTLPEAAAKVQVTYLMDHIEKLEDEIRRAETLTTTRQDELAIAQKNLEDAQKAAGGDVS